MLTYMRARSIIMEERSRRLSGAEVLSASRSPPSAGSDSPPGPPGSPACPESLLAPYPAFLTAAMTREGGTSPSTPIELVRRLTEQLVTPSSLETAFSTRAWQAAQLIPVTA